MLQLFLPCGEMLVRWWDALPSPHLSGPPAQSPGTGRRKNKLHAPFAFNYGSCLNLPTLKEEQIDPGWRPTNAHTHPVGISEQWLWRQLQRLLYTVQIHCTVNCMILKSIFNRALICFHSTVTVTTERIKELMILVKMLHSFLLFIYKLLNITLKLQPLVKVL